MNTTILNPLARPHNSQLRQDKRTLCWYRRMSLIDAPTTTYPTISRIWEASEHIEFTPAAKYLKGRLGQVPNAEMPALKWLPADNGLLWQNGNPFKPPMRATGWLAAAYYHLTALGDLIGDPIQIQLLPLQANGKRLPEHRKAKTYGVSNGTITACPALQRDKGIGVVIAESVITALAADILDNNAARLVISTGGTSQALQITKSLSYKYLTAYHADGDEAGNNIADKLKTLTIRYPNGEDAADRLQSQM